MQVFLAGQFRERWIFVSRQQWRPHRVLMRFAETQRCGCGKAWMEPLSAMSRVHHCQVCRRQEASKANFRCRYGRCCPLKNFVCFDNKEPSCAGGMWSMPKSSKEELSPELTWTRPPLLLFHPCVITEEVNEMTLVDGDRKNQDISRMAIERTTEDFLRCGALRTICGTATRKRYSETSPA